MPIMDSIIQILLLAAPWSFTGSDVNVLIVTALFNHGPEGWHIGYSSLKLVEDGHLAYAPYVKIINLRF
jgi:hypothetical protein